MSISAKTRAALHERAQDCCEVCGVHGATNAHHRRNQSQGGPDTLSNLILVCGSGNTGCHGKITENPAWADEWGYTITGDLAVPAEIPVRRFDRALGCGQSVLLADEGCIEPAAPPAPVWGSEGLAVWVNGGLIEITAGGDFIRLAPEEAAALPAGFASAIAAATAWAARWDGTARSYRCAA